MPSFHVWVLQCADGKMERESYTSRSVAEIFMTKPKVFAGETAIRATVTYELPKKAAKKK